MTVIFDLDGTLIDSSRDITRSINHVRQSLYRLPPLTVEEVTRHLNRTDVNLATLFYGTPAYQERARRLFEAHYLRQCLVHSRPYPGIERSLQALQARGVRLCVATNAPTCTSEAMLRHHGLARYFDAVIGADRVVRPKPAPDMIETILFDRDSPAWMVGDSLKDMEAARAAGIEGLFAAWGYSPPPKGPWRRIERPEELQRAFGV